MNATVRVVPFGSPEYLAIVDLRRRVLRLPIGLDFTPEQLAAEHDQLHAGVYTEKGLVACATLVPNGNATEQKVRQVAVEPERQGQGYGALAMRWAEGEAIHRGATHIALHSRESAASFYERLGYSPEGGPFEEVGLPHLRMSKSLK